MQANIQKSPAEIVARLTPRQAQIFRLLSEGLTNKQIATQLGISHTTVKRHQRDVLQRTGIYNRMILICAMAICQYEQSKGFRDDITVTQIGTFE